MPTPAPPAPPETRSDPGADPAASGQAEQRARHSPISLLRAARRSWDAMRTTRDRAAANVGEWVGSYYGPENRPLRRPVNLIRQLADSLTPALVPQTFKASVTAKRAGLAWEGELIRMQLDQLAREHDDLETLAGAVQDAILRPWVIFHCGIKASERLVTVDDQQLDPGEPFEEQIDLDDYFVDASAKRYRDRRYEGHFFRVSRAEALALGVFGRDPGEPGAAPEVATREEAAVMLGQLSATGEEQRGGSRSPTQDVGRARSIEPETDLSDRVELCQVAMYLSNEQGEKVCRVYIFAAGAEDEESGLASDKFLLCQEYEGIEDGPYQVMSLVETPGNLYPTTLADAIRDLHDAARQVSEKIVYQIVHAKRNYVVRPGAEDVFEALRDAAPEEGIKGEPDSIAEIEFAGVLKDMYPGMQFLEAHYASQSGSAPLIGGQDSQATDKTATAASILSAQANLRIGRLRARVRQFWRAILRRRAWYLITDPLIQTTMPYRLPGGYLVDVTYSAEQREGAFIDFNFDVDQRSMEPQDPAVAAQQKLELLTAIAGLVPVFQMGLLEPRATLRQMGREFGWENLDEIALDPMMMQQQALMLAGATPERGQQRTGGAPPGAGPSPMDRIDVVRSAMSGGVPPGARGAAA